MFLQHKHNVKSNLVLRLELKRREKKRREGMRLHVSGKQILCNKAGVYRMLHFNSVQLISQFMLFGVITV